MNQTLQAIEEITRDYPRFADGRIDYTNAVLCPVVNCTVVHKDEILLAHRSDKVLVYPNTWNGISGFIDLLRPLEEIVLTELQEEAGILKNHIRHLKILNKIVQDDAKVSRQWHVFPALAVLNEKPKLTTNWENRAVQWVPIHEIAEFDLMPGFKEVFQTAMTHFDQLERA